MEKFFYVFDDISLFHRIGGDDIISRIVDLLFDKVFSDEKINHFFEGTDQELVRNKQKRFMAYALGGPRKYFGRGLQKSHRVHVIHDGLDDHYFDVMMDHLQVSLQQMKIPKNTIKEVLEIYEDFRDHILCRI